MCLNILYSNYCISNCIFDTLPCCQRWCSETWWDCIIFNGSGSRWGLAALCPRACPDRIRQDQWMIRWAGTWYFLMTWWQLRTSACLRAGQEWSISWLRNHSKKLEAGRILKQMPPRDWSKRILDCSVFSHAMNSVKNSIGENIRSASLAPILAIVFSIAAICLFCNGLSISSPQNLPTDLPLMGLEKWLAMLTAPYISIPVCKSTCWRQGYTLFQAVSFFRGIDRSSMIQAWSRWIHVIKRRFVLQKSGGAWSGP